MIIAQRAKKMRILSAVLLALVLTVVPKTAHAYVLMGEHVLELMVKALGQADTLEVKASTTRSMARGSPPATRRAWKNLPSSSSVEETAAG